MKKIKVLLALTVIIFAQGQVFAKIAIKENYKLAYLNMSWWQKFNDPILESYMQKAFESNHDLKIASLKIKQGQQVVKQSLGRELPQFQILGSLDRTMNSSDIRYGDVLIPEFSQSQFLLPLTMNYEADIWGKNRLKTKSAKKQLDIIKQNERATYISLTSALATNYYNLVKIDKMLSYQNKIVDIQKKVTDLTEAKYKNGLTSVTDVICERKNLTVVQDEKNTLEENSEILENQIKTLLDMTSDEKLNRISFDKITLIEIPNQIASEAIEKRPDFIISQEQLKKIGFDVRVAKKELLPSFILSGQVGFNAYSGWSGNNFLSSVGVIPRWDAFTGGQKMAYMKFKKYEYEEATEKYKKTVLTSFQEINDSLITAKTARKNYHGSVERLNLENDKYSLISQKYAIGGTSNLQKLKMEEMLLISEKNEVSNKINCEISAINLYKAVGGQDITKFYSQKL